MKSVIRPTGLLVTVLVLSASAGVCVGCVWEPLTSRCCTATSLVPTRETGIFGKTRRFYSPTGSVLAAAELTTMKAAEKKIELDEAGQKGEVATTRAADRAGAFLGTEREITTFWPVIPAELNT
jgi:hypothetical protein